MCQSQGIQRGERICQQIHHGAAIDDAIGELLVQTVTPLTLEVALTVQQEIESRSEESDRLHHQEVECARYESDLARRRFMQCDPDNRLVADSLEAEWNQALRALSDAQDRYEKHRQSDRAGLDNQQRADSISLARDFPRLWNDPALVRGLLTFVVRCSMSSMASSSSNDGPGCRRTRGHCRISGSVARHAC